MNEDLLIKPKSLEKLCCAINNAEMRDFTHVKTLEVLSFIIEGQICPVIKISKSLISLKINKSCIMYSIVDVYDHFEIILKC